MNRETKGWIVETGDQSLGLQAPYKHLFQIVDPTTREGIADIIIDGTFPCSDDEANAKLIAAAPELLEALTALMKAETRGINDEYTIAFNKAQSAINKATI